MAFERVNTARVYTQGKGTEWLTGESTWTSLGEEILSNRGKMIVSEDPDLTIDTIRRLLMLQNGDLFDVPFSFGNPDDDESEENIGLALLSSCIKDNKDATWAEIVARYAAIRRCPFLETAIALKRLEKESGGLFYYETGTKMKTKWWPKRARMLSSDIGKKADLDSEWDLLAAPKKALGF